MKRKLLFAALFLPMTLAAQAPAESQDVMLQGFYWDSQKETGWAQLRESVSELGKTFTAIWLPPSASAEGGGAVGGNNVGYHPRQWNNQTSCWGTAADLKALIADFHANGVRVIADIVVNHRAGDTDWGNFTADDFGAYGAYQLTAEHICSNDEMNTDASSGAWYGTAGGAADTGENWGGARDLDHTSAYVQADVTAYLNWLHGEYGYDGWRYDFVKGFAGEYVGLYNKATQPYLSVGEYWDGSYDKVAAWINSTDMQSMAFDFPMKYAALNDGLAKSDYSKMSWIEDNTTWRPAGMIHHHNYNRYAVTFVDNHDTYRDANKFTGYVEQAYAFILSAPGVPCVFWPHWKAYKSAIRNQVAARRAAGLHSQSNVTVTVRDKYYESLSEGKNGSLICRIGFAAPRTVPDGYYLACNGSNWWYYLSDNLQGIHTVVATPAVSVSGKNLSVQCEAPVAVQVVSADGRTLFSGRAATLSLPLDPGNYVVRVADTSHKFVVR